MRNGLLFLMKKNSKTLDKGQLAQAIGNRIKAVRAERGISQSELARICGKDKQHIELIENGKVSATSYSLYTLSQGLNISLSELLKFD